MNTEKQSIKILKAIDILKLDYTYLEKGLITQDYLNEHNNFLLEKYPTLASKIKEDTLDMDIITQMLLNLDKMDTGEQSEHDASVKVGTILRDKIVIPDLKKNGKDFSVDDSKIDSYTQDEAEQKVKDIFKL